LSLYGKLILQMSKQLCNNIFMYLNSFANITNFFTIYFKSRHRILYIITRTEKVRFKNIVVLNDNFKICTLYKGFNVLYYLIYFIDTEEV
jgi:hypothetical protein